MRRAIAVAVLLVATAAHAQNVRIAPGRVITNAAPPPATIGTRNVLLVGNSLTYFNEMPWIFEQVATSLHAAPPLRAEFCGGSGMTLEQHWRKGNVQKRLREARWDYVVVQAQSVEAVGNRANFERYARLLIDAARKAGAQPLLMQTWAPRGQTQSAFDDSYTKLARETKTKLVPIGAAWQRLTGEGVTLFDDSGVHPNLAGSYLAACILYATTYGRSPEGAQSTFDAKFDIPETYRAALEHEHLSDGLAARIQRAAWAAARAAS